MVDMMVDQEVAMTDYKLAVSTAYMMDFYWVVYLVAYLGKYWADE